MASFDICEWEVGVEVRAQIEIFCSNVSKLLIGKHILPLLSYVATSKITKSHDMWFKFISFVSEILNVAACSFLKQARFFLLKKQNIVRCLGKCGWFQITGYNSLWLDHIHLKNVLIVQTIKLFFVYVRP